MHWNGWFALLNVILKLFTSFYVQTGPLLVIGDAIGENCAVADAMVCTTDKSKLTFSTLIAY